MRERFAARLEALRLAFGRLNQREQLFVAGGGAASVLLVFLVISMLVGGAISSAERRVKTKTDQLLRVLELQSTYRERKAHAQQRIEEISRSKVRLVSVVEEAQQGAGIKIDQLKPEDGEPNSEGVVESRVDLRASNMSITRLEDFLERLQKSPGIVVVQRLKIERPFRKDTLDVEMTVVTFRMGSGT